MKKVQGCFLFLFVLFFSTGCRHYKDVTFAVIYPSRDDIAPYIKNGMTLFLRNAEDVFTSYRINLIQKSVELKPTLIKHSFIEIEKQYKPLFYVVFTSFIALSIKDLSERFEAPVFVLGSNPSITRSTNTMFRYFFSADEEGLLHYKVIKGKGLKRVALLYQDEPYAIGVRDKILCLLKGETIKVKTYAFSVDLYKDKSMRNIDFGKYDGLVLLGYPGNLSYILSLLKRKDYKGTLLLSIPFDEFNALYNGPEVFLIVTEFSDPMNVISERLKRKYKTLFGEKIRPLTALVYDSLRFIFLFIHENSFFTRGEVLNFYEKEFTYIGPLGTIHKTQNKRDVFIPLKIGKLVNGKIVIDGKR